MPPESGRGRTGPHREKVVRRNVSLDPATLRNLEVILHFAPDVRSISGAIRWAARIACASLPAPAAYHATLADQAEPDAEPEPRPKKANPRAKASRKKGRGA